MQLCQQFGWKVWFIFVNPNSLFGSDPIEYNYLNGLDLEQNAIVSIW